MESPKVQKVSHWLSKYFVPKKLDHGIIHERKPFHHLCQLGGHRNGEVRTSTKCAIGDGRPPTFNDGILISWGPINPYGLGLMTLSPVIWKKWKICNFLCVTSNFPKLMDYLISYPPTVTQQGKLIYTP